MILKHLTKKECLIALLCSVALVIDVYLELSIPEHMNAITRITRLGGGMDEVLKEGLRMLLCALGSLIMSIICAFLATYVATSFSKRIREKQFDNVQTFSIEEMERFSIPSLITRSTNDVTQIQVAITVGLQTLIKAPVMATWAISRIHSANMEWTLATGIAVLSILAVVVTTMVFVFPRFKRIQHLTDNVNRITRENITGIRVVRAYNAEQYQTERFEAANKVLTDNNIFTQRAMSFMSPIIAAILYGLSAVIYIIGAVLIGNSLDMDAQLTTFSNMMVFSVYAMQVVTSFMMILSFIMLLPRAAVSARRVEDVIGTKPSIVSGDFKENTGTHGDIVFKDVSFKYPNESNYAIKGLNFEIRHGERFAIIGSTGAGKSTLVNLIPRLYDATEGSITMDGVDVRDYDLTTLRSKIGYVTQSAFLFTGTIESNIKYGKGSKSRTEEDVKHAASIANALDFIEDRDEMYGSEVTHGGANLSGGQKQRLSIARAICKDPRIYIFDDTFSALDYKTESELKRELYDHLDDVTCIIVAQRVSSIMIADRILVLDGGEAVGIGTHDELLRSCPTYQDIVRSQMIEEEAEP